ncbi:MAG: PAS domain-containing protein [Nitrospirota bacterium]
MRKVCAWCQKELGPGGSQLDAYDAPITHGICYDCLKKVMSFLAEPVRDYLDRFPGPVFLVNSEARIITANREGFNVLGKKPEEVEGQLGGDALDCEYAGLPGGCGNTVHCKTCTIRKTINNTFQSGRSNIRVAAYPDLHHMTGENRVRFLISTEKVGDAVLLRIDEISEESRPEQI